MAFKNKFMAKSPFKASYVVGPKPGGTEKKKDPYAEALKKDSKLPEYIKQRKGLKKGTEEYASVQNKINAAYGVSKRHEAKPSKTSEEKPKAKATEKHTVGKPVYDLMAARAKRKAERKKRREERKQKK